MKIKLILALGLAVFSLVARSAAAETNAPPADDAAELARKLIVAVAIKYR